MIDTSQCTILVVEDDPLLAMDLEAILNAAGYRVIGPAATILEAVNLMHTETPDLAVLDLSLGSEMAFPIFDDLTRIGVPFIVLSGHSRGMLPASHTYSAFLQKPCDPLILQQSISAALQNADRACERKAS